MLRQQFKILKFVSEEAETRFKTILEKKTLVLEWGLRPNANLDEDIALMIVERNWFQLVEQPQPFVISIIKEFYANAFEREGNVVTFWGKPMEFDANTINEYFGLETLTDDRYEDTLPNLDIFIS